MARRKKIKTREHRPLGGSILRRKDSPGALYGQLRRDGKRLQRVLVSADDAARADAAAKIDPKAKDAAQFAEERLAAWALDVANKSPVGEGLRVVTVHKFLSEFLGTIKGHVGAAHYADVEARCTRFADFAGDRPMAGIGADVVQDYFAKLADKPGQGRAVPVRKKDGTIELDKDGKPKEVVVRGKLSPGAMRHARNALASMWQCAISRRVASANPWTAAKIARGQQFVPVNLTDDEVERILSHVVAPVRPILTFVAESGMRLGEARALTWLHVARDYSRFTVAVAKSGRARTLPTTARAREVLKDRWKKHVAKTRGADLVFDDSRGPTSMRASRAP